ncbi:MAG: ABC transporter ATP-binding protein [Chloroflexota bacterium]|nr:ABC transporter ATP-binding protein/permease [Dehalococcoidia bacterium]MDW8255136.1 ABC transporter ATP-binding protein [Chloroflexota bacterium]
MEGNGRAPALSRRDAGPNARLPLRRRIGATARASRQVLRLVWTTSRPLTGALVGVTLLRSLQPAADVWVSKLLIDAVAAAIIEGGPPERIQTAVWLVAAQLGVLIVGSLLRTLANISQQLLQDRVAQTIQLQVMEHAERLDLAAFEDPTFYDRIQQVQREVAFRPVQMVSEMFGLVRAAIGFLSMIGLLLSLSWTIALVALLAPIPAFIANTRYGWWGFQLMRRQSPLRRLLSYLTTVQTTDTFHKEVQIYGLGPYFTDRFRRLSHQYYREMRALVLRRYLAGFGWGTLSAAATSAAALFIVLEAIAGRLTLGDLTLFTRAAAAVQDDFQSVLGGFSSLYEHGLYLSTLFELLAMEPTVRAPAAPVPLRRPFRRGIEFRNVTFTYPGRPEPALQDVSFTIAPGQTVAIVGKNGAGKTTLVKLLARLYDPDAGQILVEGHDIREYDPAELRRAIGALFQDFAAFQLTARENIGFGQLERLRDDEAIARAAKRAGADQVIAALPAGYDTTLGKWFEGGHQLSGGEWQKIALARAFMRDAEILILDEPTASLDAQAEFELFQRLRLLASGRIAIFISHRFSTVRTADLILVLEGGRLVEQGDHAALIARAGVYADLFEKQAASYR